MAFEGSDEEKHRRFLQAAALSATAAGKAALQDNPTRKCGVR
jgi:hypothetical protein